MAASPDQHEDDVRDEYDFRSLRGVVRGRYAAAYTEGRRAVRLDPDVAAAFANEQAVNSALRQFLAEHPRQESENF